MNKMMFRCTLIIVIIYLTIIMCSVDGHNDHINIEHTSSLIRQQNNGISNNNKNQDSLLLLLHDDNNNNNKKNVKHHRQLFDIWNMLFFLNANDHCPPIGPKHEKCKNNQTDTDSTTTTSSSEQEYENAIPESNINITGGTDTKWMSIMMLIAAAIAMMFAIGAMILGQYGRPISHPLKGSIIRRKNLFQSFVDCALCDSISNDPQRHLEMTDSRDDYDRVTV